MKMNPVVHFEMPYKDAKRVSQFYSNAFGWAMMDAGAKMGNYVVATTTDTDDKRMVKTPGAINGGFYPSKQSKYQEPSVVISVDDIQASMKMVKKEGGKILGKPMDIPTVGTFVSFVDTEGNRVSILQPSK